MSTRTVAAARQPLTNMVRNYNFENYPPFTAATTSATGWIDGTAGGSVGTAASQYGWGCVGKIGTIACQYDNTVAKTGSTSLKVSTTATGSKATVGNSFAGSASGVSTSEAKSG